MLGAVVVAAWEPVASAAAGRRATVFYGDCTRSSAERFWRSRPPRLVYLCWRSGCCSASSSRSSSSGVRPRPVRAHRLLRLGGTCGRVVVLMRSRFARVIRLCSCLLVFGQWCRRGGVMAVGKFIASWACSRASLVGSWWHKPSKRTVVIVAAGSVACLAVSGSGLAGL